jgi:hypothetical protein
MKNISLKGIGVGIAASLVLSIPVGFMFGFYFVEIYNEVAPGVNLANDKEVAEMTNKLMFHPLSIAFVVMATLITVGIPAYITALVAKKGYTLNAVILGVFVLLLFLIDLETVVQYPSLFSVLAVFTLVVSYLSGLIRYRQVLKNAI